MHICIPQRRENTFVVLMERTLDSHSNFWNVNLSFQGPGKCLLSLAFMINRRLSDLYFIILKYKYLRR